ncbi:hypothetical protein BH11PSE5_BH11PSE5_23820 [soil metagenome]
MTGILSSSPSTGPVRLMIGALLQSLLACLLFLRAPDPSATMLRVAVAMMMIASIGAFVLALKGERPKYPLPRRQRRA